RIPDDPSNTVIAFGRRHAALTDRNRILLERLVALLDAQLPPAQVDHDADGRITNTRLGSGTAHDDNGRARESEYGDARNRPPKPALLFCIAMNCHVNRKSKARSI